LKKNIFELADKPFYTSLIYNLHGDDEIDEDVLSALEKTHPGLAKCKYTKKALAFDITNQIPLRKFLTDVVDKETALRLFYSIADICWYFNKNKFDTEYLLFDSDFVLVDSETQNITFICVPIYESEIRSKPLRVYLKELLVNIQYEETENLEYVGRIITYLNRSKNLDAFALSTFLKKLDDSSAIPDNGSLYRNEIKAMDESARMYEEPKIPDRPMNSVFKPAPYLVRKANSERVIIQGDEFKIGKIDNMADYILADNPAVSRMHAIIRYIDGAYYICDNYSTNATYLNNEKLRAGENYLLINGAKVRFANEEFTYHID